jgi:hypothetical protein
MLNIFSRLAAGEEMPAGEKVRIRRGRAAAHRPRRARRHARRGTVFPRARRRYTRLGRQQAMLLLWAVISAALVAVALALNTSGHKNLYPVDGNGVPLSRHAAACRCVPVDEPAASRGGLGDHLIPAR